ncbi:hypothetical protein Hac_1759 [Helicobacter acinonychis str. Sheeba]|uniref:Uncharacterized protein n=1 Tax=Helicobacter acinonychis (strain Sheeba) TaxID=382638 RepID=Q17V71_HELAH|nr:hypothetical protein Hac_1759 [Helicobacter acinonychis str. Sheeba]
MNNIETKYIEEYTDKASLMGLKIRTIESLLPKGSSSQTASLLKVQTLTFHRAKIEGGVTTSISHAIKNSFMRGH